MDMRRSTRVYILDPDRREDHGDNELLCLEGSFFIHLPGTSFTGVLTPLFEDRKVIWKTNRYETSED